MLTKYRIDQRDLEVVLLGKFGFSTKLIASRTNYSPGQIRYRLKRSKIKLADYRNGASDYSRMLIKGSEKFSINQLRGSIHKQIIN